jgi:SAM-dependent methyltransferase
MSQLTPYRQRVLDLFFANPKRQSLFRDDETAISIDSGRFQRSLKMIGEIKGKLIYEIGPYPGTGLYWYGEHSKMLGIGRGDDGFSDKFREAGHDFLSFDLEGNECVSDNYKNNADILLFMEVIEHLRLPMRALNHIVDMAKPGSILYLTTNNASYFGNILKLLLQKCPLDSVASEGSFYPGHMRFYHYEELAKILESLNFRILSKRNINFLPTFQIYRNRLFGMFKNALGKILPMSYASHIEIVAEFAGKKAL